MRVDLWNRLSIRRRLTLAVNGLLLLLVTGFLVVGHGLRVSEAEREKRIALEEEAKTIYESVDAIHNRGNESILSAARHELVRQIIALLITGVLAAVMVDFVLRKVVTKPLRLLVNRLKNIGNGNLNVLNEEKNCESNWVQRLASIAQAIQ